MMIISYHPEASEELDVAGLYYQRQAKLGDKFLEATRNAEDLIKFSPKAWTKLHNSIHRISLQRFPYHLIYTVKQGKILILAVAHQRRRPDYWHSRIA